LIDQLVIQTVQARRGLSLDPWIGGVCNRRGYEESAL
jgi:hypothetical protein